jgi:hypothetical protein
LDAKTAPQGVTIAREFTAEIDLAIGRQEQQAKPDPADEVAEPDRNRPTVVL